MLHFLKGQNLFNHHENKDAIKNILAILIISVVKADQKHSIQEQKTVLDFFQNEFNMSTEETTEYFDSVVHNEEEFDKAKKELNDILNTDKSAKAMALQMLNEVIICDGCVDAEYVLFEEIKSALH